MVCFVTDKQQELDLPSLRVDDSETARLSTTPRKAKDSVKDGAVAGSGVVASSSAATLASGTSASLSAKSGAPPSASSSSPSHVGRTMSHISGIKRPLSHSNSVTAEKVAKYGVDTPNEHELGKVRGSYLDAKKNFGLVASVNDYRNNRNARHVLFIRFSTKLIDGVSTSSE